ncbi:ABC transporter permease [Streptosporangium sp. NPDC000396]|uniref:ABC transporter permease n=1 Tax=Streptosporangium sp. NPDC000396 TaxID=3366185 RepID=UPI0036BC901D
MKLARDTWLIFHRQMVLFLRAPLMLAMGVIQPLFYLLLFAPLLRPALDAADEAASYAVFVPGMLVLLAIFAALFAGMGLLEEIRDGVLDRSRVTPVSRLALLLGRSLRDVLSIGIQAVILTIAALPLGLRVPLGNLLLTYLLLGLIVVALSAFSYALALKLGRIEVMAPLVNLLSQQLLLLSGILLPLTFAPAWLRAIAAVNPLSYAVDAARALFAGDFTTSGVWQALAITGVLAVITVAWASRAFTQDLH